MEAVRVTAQEAHSSQQQRHSPPKPLIANGGEQPQHPNVPQDQPPQSQAPTQDEIQPQHESPQVVSPQDALLNEPNRHRFETMLTIPHSIQDALFCWRSEITMCERIATLGIALDVITNSYFLCLANFTRTSDIRLRLVDAPTPYMLVPVHYCDRVLHASLAAIANLRTQIARVLSALQDELRMCANFRKSTERSCIEFMQRGVSDGGAIVLEWRNRAAILQELETRIRAVVKGGPNFFEAFKKPWGTILNTQSASDGIITPRWLKPRHETNTRNAPNNNSNCTPDDDVRTLGERAQPGAQPQQPQKQPSQQRQDPRSQQEQRQKADSAHPDEAAVPETPEAETMAVVQPLPTQVSSPRNRKRNSAVEDEHREGDENANGNDPVARNLVLSAGAHDSPVQRSVQMWQNMLASPAAIADGQQEQNPGNDGNNRVRAGGEVGGHANASVDGDVDMEGVTANVDGVAAAPRDGDQNGEMGAQLAALNGNNVAVVGDRDVTDGDRRPLTRRAIGIVEDRFEEDGGQIPITLTDSG